MMRVEVHLSIKITFLSTPVLDFILLVDDDEATNFLHQIIAEEAGLAREVIPVRSMAQALEELEKRSQSEEKKKGLACIDINMPLTDGFTVVQTLHERELDRSIELRIVLLSASDHPRDLNRIEQDPRIFGFVPKPLSVEKLAEIVSSF